MSDYPRRIAIAGTGVDLLAVARETAALEAGRLILIGGSPGEGEEAAREIGGASQAKDLGALKGCRVVILTGGWTRGGSLEEAAACAARYAPEAVVVAASERSLSLARTFLGASRLPSRQVVAIGGLPGQMMRTAALASRLGVDPSQISFLVAGDEEPRLIEISRYTVVAGVPVASLGLPAPNAPTPPQIPGPIARGRAAALIADAVLHDRRRILCCGSFVESAHGLPTGVITVPVVIGARGVESVFPAMLSLEERSFIHRSLPDVDARLRTP